MSNSHLTSPFDQPFQRSFNQSFNRSFSPVFISDRVGKFLQERLRRCGFCFFRWRSLPTVPKPPPKSLALKSLALKSLESVTSVTPPRLSALCCPTSPQKTLIRFTQQTPLDLPVPATTTLEPSPADIIVLPNVSPQDIDRFTQQSALELPTPTAGQLPSTHPPRTKNPC